MSTVITVENLGKKYTLRHHQREQYTALRDVLANSVKSLGKRILSPFTTHSSSLTASQEDFWALKDVSFEVKQGDRIGIIGRNGAGKSTLLKILSRITEPTTGSIRIKGRVASLLEVGTGFHPELTGRENIFLNGAILGMGRAEIKKKFDEIVDFAEIEKFLDTPVKRYSSGMYVRLAFAVAAHLEPEILIVDEVLAVGDAQFQKKCLGKMEDVSAKEGRTVVFVSHNMAALMNICTSAILLEGGMKIDDGTTQSVVPHYMERLRTCGGHGLSTQNINRRGRGRVRFISVGFEDENGSVVQHGMSGQSLSVVLRYQSESSNPLKYPYRIGIAFNDVLGQALFNCSTEVASTEIFDLPPTGSVRCVIPKLPLSQGEYLLTLFLEVNQEIEDWIQGGQTLSVIDGDFFNTGKVYPDGWNGRGVLVSHNWVLAEQSDC